MGKRPGVEGWSTMARVVGAFRGTVVPFFRLPAEMMAVGLPAIQPRRFS
jgi:hypothetical protein